MKVHYDNRRFRVADASDGEVPTAQYHQDGDVVWAEFAGGNVRRGSLAGTCDPDGVLRLAYCMVLDCGDVISGSCVSTPTILADGRIRLSERWERYGANAASGVSYLEEVR
jgi:hypothetical protein